MLPDVAEAKPWTPYGMLQPPRTANGGDDADGTRGWERRYHHVIFVVDRETITRSDHPVLVVDLYEQPGRTFRVIPAAMWSVQNNLSLGNMDWEEFAEWTDPDGIFRRFPE